MLDLAVHYPPYDLDSNLALNLALSLALNLVNHITTSSFKLRIPVLLGNRVATGKPTNSLAGPLRHTFSSELKIAVLLQGIRAL